MRYTPAVPSHTSARHSWEYVNLVLAENLGTTLCFDHVTLGVQTKMF